MVKVEKYWDPSTVYPCYPRKHWNSKQCGGRPVMAKRILQGKRRAIRPFLFALHNFACHHLYRTRGNTVAGRRSPAQYCAKRSYTLSLSLPLYIYIYFSSLGRVLSNEISHTAVSLAHGSRYIQCAGHISATRDTLMKNHTANARTVGYRANISPGMRF